MANIEGKTYSFAFWMTGAEAAGVTSASDFITSIFTCNGAVVSSVVSSSLTITPLLINGVATGDFYTASYIPDRPGQYIIAMTAIVAGFPFIIDLVDVASAAESPALSYVNLTQDTPTIDALKPSSLLNASDYLLLVFVSSDWEVGRTDVIYGVAQTGLDVDGNWLSTPLVVAHGTYHIVVRDNYDDYQVIYPYLTV